MAGIAILIALILIIATVARTYYYKQKPLNNAKERITRTGKISCVILSVVVPLIFLLFAGESNEHNERFLILTFITIESIAIVSAFHIVRFARTPVWVVGMTAFSLHAIIIGIVVATNFIWKRGP